MPIDNKSNDETDGNLQEDSLRSDGTVTVCGRMSFLPMAHATGPERVIPLGSSLIYCLKSEVEGTLIPLWLVGSFFRYVPARIGRNGYLFAERPAGRERISHAMMISEAEEEEEEGL